MNSPSPQQSNQLYPLLPNKAVERACWFFLIGLLAINSAYSAMKPLNHDVAWYLYGANRMLDGARLYVDIIDPNPPLIFYLSILPVGMAHLFGWYQTITFKLCFVSIAFVSLALNGKLTKQIVPIAPDLARKLFLLALAFIFFIFSEYDFGQREHLMFVLVMPYILASIGYAQGRSIRVNYALYVGALAGLGMALKPHFMLLWVSIELYLKLACPGRRSWRRPENLGIVMVFMIYSLSVLFLSREYFSIAAMAVRTYGAYNCSLLDLLKNTAIALWSTGLASFAAARFNSQNKVAKEVLLIVSTVFLIIAIIQQKGWGYHFYPAKATVILLLSVTVPELLEGLYNYSKRILRAPTIIHTAAICVGLILLTLIFHLTIAQSTYRIASWSWEAGDAVAKGRTSLRKGVYTLLHQSFGVVLPAELQQLIPIAEQYAYKKPILVLSSSVFPAFPLVNHTDAVWSSRFNCLWLLPGSYNTDSPTHSRAAAYHTFNQMSGIEQFQFQGIISDMAANPPALLIVDVSPNKQGFGQTQFDYIDYFSQDERFTKLFSEYDLLTKVTCRCPDQNSYVVYKWKHL